MPKEKQLNSTAKQIICSVYDYFENESKKCKGSVLSKLGKKTSEATGYCKQTVERIIAEKRKLEGADLVFQSKKATGDYHDETNSDNSEEWFHDKLSCNVPYNSLTVMDNASYHSRRIEKVPTSNSRKGDMQDWLTSHGIEYPEQALKRELLSLIK